MTIWRHGISCAFCLLTLMGGTVRADATRYTVTDLGLSGKHSQAEALNNRGQVVGWQENSSFLWEDGKQQIISKQPYQGAHGINEEGQIVGIPGEIHLFQSGAFDILSGASAFIWDRGHMDFLPGFSEAYGINSQGEIAGESNHRATIWRKRYVIGGLANDPNFIWQSLPAHKIPLTPGYPYSIAFAINDAGQAVGVMLRDLTNVPEHGRAFRYQDGKAVLLPLPAPGNSTAFSVNASGTAAGAFSVNASGTAAGAFHLPGSGWRAALWSPSGAMQTLPVLPGYAHAVAHSVNLIGQAVGWASRQSSGLLPRPFGLALDTRACLWQGGSVLDLNTLIAPGSGWTLQQAEAINDKGWIVGGGTVHGEYHAFLLRPNPAPSPGNAP